MLAEPSMKTLAVLAVAICLLSSGCERRIQPDLSSKVTDGGIIEAIDVRGNTQVKTDTIRHGLHLKRGERISLPVIKNDIELLYSLGFEEVRVEEESGQVGNVVVFQVKETPQKQVQ
jgi:outer membrane protein assembly factor BamA